jgi:hypothetical protein
VRYILFSPEGHGMIDKIFKDHFGKAVEVTWDISGIIYSLRIKRG